jgi:hypothetical protein
MAPDENLVGLPAVVGGQVEIAPGYVPDAQGRGWRRGGPRERLRRSRHRVKRWNAVCATLGTASALLATRASAADERPAAPVDLTPLREDQQRLGERLDALESRVSGRITGYLDFGFFAVQGDGSGIRPDTGHQRFPEYAGPDGVPDTWVFLGDPLSTAINARGEPADTGPSRAIAFDSVDSQGKASFIVNALDVALFAGLGPDLTLNGLVDFLPRSRNIAVKNDTGLGDFMDVKLAYAEYTLPIDRAEVRVYAGKIDSTVGIEYRTQESPDRIGVTPSLICRYTCGRPIGLKLRARLPEDLLTLALAVTNGTSFVETFPFHDEIDSNQGKTVSGRLSLRLPVGGGVELGGSGAYGAQDQQPRRDLMQWHAGADLHAEAFNFDLRAEYVQGRAPGHADETGVPCAGAPCLKYRGAYGQLALRASNLFIPYARVDWRDAHHRDGGSFAYESQLVRATGGLRAELGTSTIVKAEYTWNRELGRLPQIPNDVFTSSLVIKY